MIKITRYHDISAGHKVTGHEGACARLHGHNYRFHFTCTSPDLDDVGRVIDFSEIKKKLCIWLEDNWDHKFLIWEDDPWASPLALIDNTVVWVNFNPTAENLAKYLAEIVAPKLLQGTGVTLIECTVSETRKCSATYLTSVADVKLLAKAAEASYEVR